MNRDLPLIPEEFEQRLREWGIYFRDRHRFQRCASAEGNFQAGSDDFAKEGWGDQEKTPTPAPKARNWVLRAIEIQGAFTTLAKLNGGRPLVWTLTYHYAYPYLPKGLVLRCMKKHTGKRISWKVFDENLGIGQIRVYALIK